jgi:hypothetical protein
MSSQIDTQPDAAPVVRHKLEQAVRLGTDALRDMQTLELERFEQKLRTLDALCREAFQDELRDTYVALADRLERGEALTDQERGAIEVLFTGAARVYLKTENNFDDWIAELQRLLAELQAAGQQGFTRMVDLMHVQALCRDAMHVMPEVLHYVREKERVELFRQSMSGRITAENGRMLARMIRDMMSSPDR